MSEPFLELRTIRKVYPGVIALDGVGVAVHAGEVIGLVGENGAGKSTLMKILGGVTPPTSGEIRIDGRARSAMTVPDAMAAGIAFVHQELNLFDNLDAAGNIFIGREPRRGPLRLLDRRRMHDETGPLFERLGVEFAPDTPVARLSIAQRQLVEIAKALSLNSRVVIMDEPTSSLTLTESDGLLRLIADLRDAGVSTIFISHRLNEVAACADRVLVLRDGQMVAALDGPHMTPDTMVRHMIGRDMRAIYRPPAAAPGKPVLEIRGARTASRPHHEVDLAVRRGEILGLAGLIGAGRTELARAVFGIEPLLAGEVRLSGRPIAVRRPANAIAAGLYLVPEDRKASGVILDLPVTDNVALPQLGAMARLGLVDATLETQLAEGARKRLDIRVARLDTPAGALSGGNQQKVVLAKWLEMAPRAIVFDEPTRGVDVGAKQEIYGILRGLADAGVAILMISSDMEEVIGVSDRIAVMHEGRISGTLERDDFSEAAVLHLAVGRQAA